MRLREAAPPAGRELRTVLGLVGPALRASAAALWRPEGLAARYQRYLVTMHEVVRASVPLLSLALHRCADADPADRIAPLLRERLPVHIAEERHHDEWLLRDMAVAGLDPAAEIARPPSELVAALVGAQYYWISHYHPVCLLGYVAVLESNAPSPRLAGFLAAGTGLPAAAFHTVHHHAEVDAGHSTAIFDLLDRLDLDQAQRLAVRTSALHTARTLIDLFDTLATS
jgi:hypothetical protein